MDTSVTNHKIQTQKVTVEDVNRFLDLGRLLFSVLTPEEIEALHEVFSNKPANKEIGNTGDS